MSDKATVTYKGRPKADGSVSWSLYIRRADGTEELIPRPEFSRPEDKPAMVALAAAWRKGLAKGLSEAAEQTSNEWFDLYTKKSKALGRTDAEKKRTRWRKWIAPHIGHLAMADVTRKHAEDIRDALDRAIGEWKVRGKSGGKKGTELSGKTAMNVWSAATSAFKEATTGKDRELKVLDGKPNPFHGVQPPGDKDTRKARRKTFLYPREAYQLLSCEAVPLDWREVYALALYAYSRPGELRVLTWDDVREHTIQIDKAWDYADEKVKPPKTRNGVRAIPIDPALAPLLARMRRDATEAKGEDVGRSLVVPRLSAFGEDHLAEQFRRHLKLAKVDRLELHRTTLTHVQSNFRSCRDSGATWLAMGGLGVDKIMRRLGHDEVETSMVYIRQAEDLAGDLGVPFGALPPTLVSPKRESASGDDADGAACEPSVNGEPGALANLDYRFGFLHGSVPEEGVEPPT